MTLLGDAVHTVTPLQGQGASLALRDACDLAETWARGPGDWAALAAAGAHRPTPAGERRQQVKVLDVYERAAVVRVDATDWVDSLHLAEVDGRWVIVNVLWERRPAAGGWRALRGRGRGAGGCSRRRAR